MSPDVLQFLYNLVCAQQLSAGAEDFDAVAAIVSKTKAELAAALQAEPMQGDNGKG